MYNFSQRQVDRDNRVPRSLWVRTRPSRIFSGSPLTYTRLEPDVLGGMHFRYQRRCTKNWARRPPWNATPANVVSRLCSSTFTPGQVRASSYRALYPHTCATSSLAASSTQIVHPDTKWHTCPVACFHIGGSPVSLAANTSVELANREPRPVAFCKRLFAVKFFWKQEEAPAVKGISPVNEIPIGDFFVERWSESWWLRFRSIGSDCGSFSFFYSGFYL